MIVYLATGADPRAFGRYRELVGFRHRRRVRALRYEEAVDAPIGRLPRGIYVFADVERLTPDLTRAAAALRDRLFEAGRMVRALNDPVHSLRRLALLRSLYDCGRNPFQVWPLSEGQTPSRWPVFLRGENDHKGALAGPCADESALLAAARKIEAAGLSRESMLAVEFCDTSDPDGVFRKYGAFRVGERILPRHLFFSRDWMIKEADLLDAEKQEEELRYVAENPHGRELHEIFERACIDYGRIDYAVRDGQLIVWEINTHPVVVKRSMFRDRRRADLHPRVHGTLPGCVGRAPGRRVKLLRGAGLEGKVGVDRPPALRRAAPQHDGGASRTVKGPAADCVAPGVPANHQHREIVALDFDPQALAVELEVGDAGPDVTPLQLDQCIQARGHASVRTEPHYGGIEERATAVEVTAADAALPGIEPVLELRAC